MILWRKTLNASSRNALVIDRDGITISYERTKVGGGWYIRDLQTMPWPWSKVS